MSDSKLKPTTILLVEDDPGHAHLIQKNLRRARLNNPIITLSDGQQVIDYLFGTGPYAETQPTRPLLILLDLNLPVLDGYQVLERIRSDERTRQIPVIVLTTTDDEAEAQRCYELGANVFLTKPIDYVQFGEAVRKLGLFLAVMSEPD